MSHLVDRLELEVRVPDPTEARQLGDRLSRLHRQAIAAVLARVFDQLSPPGALHRLETLSLDLGAIPLDQLERQFPERLERALRQALPSRLSTGPRVDTPGAGPLQDTADADAPFPAPRARRPSPASPPPPGPRSAPKDPGAGPLELLAFYAASGTLPWWAPRHDARLIPAVFDAASRLPREVLEPFLRQLAAAPAARQRLLASLDPGQQPWLLQALSHEAPEVGRIADREARDVALTRDTRDQAVDLETSEASPHLDNPEGALRRVTPERPRSPNAPDRASSLPPSDPTASPVPTDNARRRPPSDTLPPRPLPTAPPDTNPPTPESRPLELLAIHAATGTLPRWAPRHDARLIPTTFAAALRLPPEVLAPFLRQLATAPAAQRRLLAALDPAQQPLLRLALLSEAPEGGLIHPIRGWPEVTLPGGTQRQALELETSEATLHPPGPSPVPEPTETATRPTPSKDPVSQRLSSDTLPPRPLPSAPPDTNPPTPESRPLELLAFHAATGALPGWAPRDDARLIPTAFDAAFRLPPIALAPMLRQLACAPAAQRRLLAALDPGQRSRLIESLRTAALDPPASVIPPETPVPSPHHQGDTLTVEGAGLALLWPFLDTLFARLGWLTPERRFAGAVEQQRALALLGYLVDGDPDPPEWRLPLGKVLCGLPLDAVFALDEDLSAAELAEADKLLQAVLAHGDGLLGQEVDTLRATWLQRPGLLTWRPQAWLLVVERRDDLDGALERLPWTVSWLRLPWMRELMQVGW